MIVLALLCILVFFSPGPVTIVECVVFGEVVALVWSQTSPQNNKNLLPYLTRDRRYIQYVLPSTIVNVPVVGLGGYYIYIYTPVMACTV